MKNRGWKRLGKELVQAPTGCASLRRITHWVINKALELVYSLLESSLVCCDCDQELRLNITCLNFKVNFKVSLAYPKHTVF